MVFSWLMSDRSIFKTTNFTSTLNAGTEFSTAAAAASEVEEEDEELLLFFLVSLMIEVSTKFETAFFKTCFLVSVIAPIILSVLEEIASFSCLALELAMRRSHISLGCPCSFVINSSIFFLLSFPFEILVTICMANTIDFSEYLSELLYLLLMLLFSV
uniref:Wsv450 n=1 Tax=White spot syndrome virus TaxID=92652 RepID=A0A2U9GHQ1_WSSV|nr:wsv450 [Shrimp white spot syndrome virus]AWQ61014.1 wsv450 [Shrimp white spot syndrome virus]AWQ61425.1 wsv450 [Shrimp white spot syndrome virus]AWQ61874.1 wsv450 [Shrimp white spot syndrome virus]AWQ63101.1 wsv450 [Shrimp white spot syndrome virus]